MTSPLHSTSMAHDNFLVALDQIITSPGSTVDERQLATMLRDIYSATCAHPAVVDYLNRYYLGVLDRSAA